MKKTKYRIAVKDILGNRTVSIAQSDYPHNVSRISEMSNFCIDHILVDVGVGNFTAETRIGTTHFNTKHIVSISVTEEEAE